MCAWWARHPTRPPSPRAGPGLPTACKVRRARACATLLAARSRSYARAQRWPCATAGTAASRASCRRPPTTCYTRSAARELCARRAPHALHAPHAPHARRRAGVRGGAAPAVQDLLRQEPQARGEPGLCAAASRALTSASARRPRAASRGRYPSPPWPSRRASFRWRTFCCSATTWNCAPSACCWGRAAVSACWLSRTVQVQHPQGALSSLPGQPDQSSGWTPRDCYSAHEHSRA
jgi:hypothetical protein